MALLLICGGIVASLGVIRSIESVYNYYSIDYKVRKISEAQRHLFDVLSAENDIYTASKIKSAIAFLDDILVEVDNDENCN